MNRSFVLRLKSEHFWCRSWKHFPIVNWSVRIQMAISKSTKFDTRLQLIWRMWRNDLRQPGPWLMHMDNARSSISSVRNANKMLRFLIMQIFLFSELWVLIFSLQGVFRLQITSIELQLPEGGGWIPIFAAYKFMYHLGIKWAAYHFNFSMSNGQHVPS